MLLALTLSIGCSSLWEVETEDYDTLARTNISATDIPSRSSMDMLIS
jgi:hypothetical protein